MTSGNKSTAYDFYISPPPPPFGHYGGYPEGGWLLASVGTYANKTCRDGPFDNNMPDCSVYPQPDDTWTDNTIDGCIYHNVIPYHHHHHHYHNTQANSHESSLAIRQRNWQEFLP